MISNSACFGSELPSQQTQAFYLQNIFEAENDIKYNYYIYSFGYNQKL